MSTPDGDLLTRVFGSLPAAVALLQGPNHVIGSYNERYQQLVGPDRALAGLPVAEALPEIVDQVFVGLMDDVYRTGEPFVGHAVEATLHRGAGGEPERAFVDFAYVATRDEHGEIDGILAHVVEVTDLVLAREEASALADQLAVERARLHEVIEQLQAGVAIADADGQLVLANRSWRDSFEMEVEQVAAIADIDDYTVFQGRRADGTAYRPEEFPVSRALLHDEVVRSERIAFSFPDGRERIVDVSATRIRSSVEEPVSAVVTTVDVTDQLALEREVADQRSRELRREAETDRRHAYELNDAVVQRLAVADLAFSLGRPEEAHEAVRAALDTAKQLIDSWGSRSRDLSLSADRADATEQDSRQADA